MRGILIVWVLSVTSVGCAVQRTPDAGADARAETFDAIIATFDVNADEPDHDTASEAATPTQCNCGGPIPCPGGNAIRCDPGIRCAPSGEYPFVVPGGDYAVCTREMGEALLARGFCERPWEFTHFVPRTTCQGRCDVRRRDPRYAACQSRINFYTQDPRQLGLFCTGYPSEGVPCRESEYDCSPAADVPDLALACRAGRCVRVPRSAGAPPFGESCGIDERTLSVAGLQTSTRGACVISGSTGCFRQRLTKGCRLDEDCPAGWDCMLGEDCHGTCLPREARRDPANLAAPCAPADAAVGDASEDARDAESDAR